MCSPRLPPIPDGARIDTSAHPWARTSGHGHLGTVPSGAIRRRSTWADGLSFGGLVPGPASGCLVRNITEVHGAEYLDWISIGGSFTIAPVPETQE